MEAAKPRARGETEEKRPGRDQGGFERPQPMGAKQGSRGQSPIGESPAETRPTMAAGWGGVRGANCNLSRPTARRIRDQGAQAGPLRPEARFRSPIDQAPGSRREGVEERRGEATLQRSIGAHAALCGWHFPRTVVRPLQPDQPEPSTTQGGRSDDGPGAPRPQIKE